MRILDIITKKRDNHELSTEEINFVVEAYTNGSIPDYQMSALLMAIYFNKMNKRETYDLAIAIANSGDHITYPGIDGIKVDKHSSGGVGDKTTLAVGPMVAACGLIVPKMSGRGLGYSGGTLDKLESIKGFRVAIPEEEFVKLVNENGISVIGQTANVAPADKKIYALRDVTATVDDMSLIASSIMSKKLATESDAIVLDVKVGSGAFMKDIDSAIELGEAMCDIGRSAGKKMTACITNMDEPLGFAVGNALEIKEVIDTLRGRGPEDFTELCYVIGSQMLISGEIAKTEQEAREMIKDVIDTDAAYEKFKTMIASQGGDIKMIEDTSLLPSAQFKLPVTAEKSGLVEEINAQTVGETSVLVGAGRYSKEDSIDYGTGIVLSAKVGDSVEKGDVLCVVHANNMKNGEEAVERLNSAFKIGTKPRKEKILRALINNEGVKRF